MIRVKKLVESHRRIVRKEATPDHNQLTSSSYQLQDPSSCTSHDSTNTTWKVYSRESERTLQHIAFEDTSDNQKRSSTSQSRCLVPKQVGFCELVTQSIANKDLMIDEQENFAYDINQLELSKGKFQVATKLCSSHELDRFLPGILGRCLANFNAQVFEQGLTVISKRSYMLENSLSCFDHPEKLNTKEVIESTLVNTNLKSRTSFYTSRLTKTINSNFLIPKTSIDFDFRISVLKDNQWLGSYKELGIGLQETEAVLQLNKDIVQRFGEPKHVVIADLCNPSKQITGGKNIIFFHTVEFGDQTKTLVNELTVVGLEASSTFVKVAMKAAKDWIYSSVQREAAKSIDGMRTLSQEQITTNCL